MLDITIQILKILLASWFITRFEPIKWFIEILPDNLIFNMIKYIPMCSKCFSFWFGLIYIHNFWLAALSSLIMVIVEKYILSEIEQVVFKK